MFLSPNQRLALFASRQYRQKVYSFQGWIELLWQNLNKSVLSGSSSTHLILPTSISLSRSKTIPKLLTSIEQISIFEDIILKSPLEYPLLRREATAKSVSEAWDLCRQWNLSLEDLSRKQVENPYLFTEDHRTYLSWAKAYQEKCQAENWLDPANLLNYIGEVLQQCFPDSLDLLDLLTMPSRITCLGFLEWTPQQKRFLEICALKGVQVEMKSLKMGGGVASNVSSNNSKVFRLGLQDEEEELKQSLYSANAYLMQNPRAKIGVIVPDLEKKRFAILRILQDMGSKEEYTQSISSCDETPAQVSSGAYMLVCEQRIKLATKSQLERRRVNQKYNVAAPITLAQYPIIDAAFLGLELLQDEMPFQKFSELLRSVFLGAIPEDICQVAELEVQLRKIVKTKHSLAEYVFLMGGIRDKFPKLKACRIIDNLQNCIALRSGFFGIHSCIEWRNLIIEYLNALNWPGTRELNEEESALKLKWDEILSEYEAMGPILKEHRFSIALKEIRRLATHRTFLSKALENESSIDAPVQVLGLLEGLGVPFDYLWVLGMHRDAWPKEPAPNPFIPLSIQVTLDMPRNSAARELQIADRMTKEFVSQASEVVFSYPKIIQEQETTYSALIADFPELTNNPLTVQIPDNNIEPPALNINTERLNIDRLNAEKLNTEIKFEQESQQPSTDVATQPLVLGGTKILALQAVCPFRAFSEIRLQAEPLQKPKLGLSSAERGEIIHQVLVIFWLSLKSQAALLALTEEECSTRIEQAVQLVLQKWQRVKSTSFAEGYLAIERRRIYDLINRFLELEKLRPPFEVIAHEVPQELILGGLRLKLRIDRIDKLENGDELLIDYKTGQVQISEWFGERPLAPQLPLYCIARKTKASAVAFAIIRPDEMRYKGLQMREAEIAGIDLPAKMQRYGAEETFEMQNTVWEHNLENLAIEFKGGRADIQPLKGDQSCRSCHLKSLCRLGLT